MNKYVRLSNFLIIMFILVNFCGCAKVKTDVNLSDIADELIGYDSSENFKKGDSKEFKRYYGLNVKDFEDVVLYCPESNMDVNEILIVKVKNENDIDAVEDALDSRVENQGNVFKDYAPDKYAVIQDYEIYVKDDIMFFVISQNSEDIKKEFKKLLLN